MARLEIGRNVIKPNRLGPREKGRTQFPGRDAIL